LLPSLDSQPANASRNILQYIHSFILLLLAAADDASSRDWKSRLKKHSFVGIPSSLLQGLAVTLTTTSRD
jgi:hypothetical protein